MTPENEAKKDYLSRYKWDLEALKEIDGEITACRLGALPAMAADGTRPIEKVFVFGNYAPEVMIHNAGMSGRSLQVNADGSLTWAKKDVNKWSQHFIILPAAVVSDCTESL